MTPQDLFIKEPEALSDESLEVKSTPPVSSDLTPMMTQWHLCKKKADGALVLFRLGDFYEAFQEDAQVISRELDLTLTQRQGVPMCGVPWHASEGYVDRLVAKGYRVAIAEQLEDPRKVKGLVKRELTRVVSPGTLTTSALLDDKANNFITSLSQVGARFGLASLDVSTGECLALEFDTEEELFHGLCHLRPSECVISAKFSASHASFLQRARQQRDFLVSTQEEWRYEFKTAYEALVTHFKVHTLDGFGLSGMTAGVAAAGALLAYVKDKLYLSLDHVQQISTYASHDYLLLDATTQRNLELTESLKDRSRKNTLLEVLDRTRTPMGGRLLVRWIRQPLSSVRAIEERQEAIACLLDHLQEGEGIRRCLALVRDLERLMMKVSAGYASPRDLVALRFSLEQLPSIKENLAPLPSSFFQKEMEYIADGSEAVQRIAQALVDEPPARLHESPCFREGYHRDLDELRRLSRDSKGWLTSYQQTLREQTGIRTLKVGFNRLFGYYLEVSRGQADRMPPSFQRKQTLVNAERFISPELKEMEHKLLTAQDRIEALEEELFKALREDIARHTSAVMKTAEALAKIDCLCSLAEVAKAFSYSRPHIDEQYRLDIKEGRHPILEAAALGDKFIPNDVFLEEDQRLLILTGPNMAGKSTYIRQVALLVIMAHMGSFLPAKEAHLGLVDRVFTRIGASDDLSRGQSTFMVEMTETANILHHVTQRSLVILDEIGRGTSTYDGISIAWAVAEYLLSAPGKQAKTLFATHYWELTALEQQRPGAANYHVSVLEHEQEVIFLRKILKGCTDKSYGIHVAKLAGLPEVVLSRSREILAQLETGKCDDRQKFKQKKVFASRAKSSDQEIQLLLFEPSPSPVPPEVLRLVKELAALDPTRLTPLEALIKLSELKTLTSKNPKELT